jgi:ATP-dependent Clp protease protease subunit
LRNQDFPADNAFITKFYENLPLRVLDDEETLWIVGEICEGFVTYAARRIMSWAEDSNIASIPVLICSRGGVLNDALAVYSLLRYFPKHKRAFIFHAASAAVFIALACDERIGFPETTILLHDLSMEFSGKGDHFKQELEGIRRYQDILTDIIVTRTNIPKEVWLEKRSEEWYLTAHEALRWGILTSIEERDDAAVPRKSSAKRKKKSSKQTGA